MYAANGEGGIFEGDGSVLMGGVVVDDVVGGGVV